MPARCSAQLSFQTDRHTASFDEDAPFARAELEAPVRSGSIIGGMVMGALQYWSPLLCATSDAAVVAATVELIDVATPGGAAIGTETAALVEAVTNDLLASHRYRANVVAVLLWPAHVLGGGHGRSRRAADTSTPWLSHWTRGESWRI